MTKQLHHSVAQEIHCKDIVDSRQMIYDELKRVKESYNESLTKIRQVIENGSMTNWELVRYTDDLRKGAGIQ